MAYPRPFVARPFVARPSVARPSVATIRGGSPTPFGRCGAARRRAGFRTSAPVDPQITGNETGALGRLVGFARAAVTTIAHSSGTSRNFSRRSSIPHISSMKGSPTAASKRAYRSSISGAISSASAMALGDAATNTRR